MVSPEYLVRQERAVGAGGLVKSVQPANLESQVSRGGRDGLGLLEKVDTPASRDIVVGPDILV